MSSRLHWVLACRHVLANPSLPRHCRCHCDAGECGGGAGIRVWRIDHRFRNPCRCRAKEDARRQATSQSCRKPQEGEIARREEAEGRRQGEAPRPVLCCVRARLCCRWHLPRARVDRRRRSCSRERCGCAGSGPVSGLRYRRGRQPRDDRRSASLLYLGSCVGDWRVGSSNFYLVFFPSFVK